MTSRTTAMPTDEELMLAYQMGDASAFDQLYDRYAAKLYGYIVARVRDRAQADDIFQGIFLRLHRSRSAYNAAFPVAPWIFTIAHNAIADAMRERSRLKEVVDEAAVERAEAPPPAEVVAAPSLTNLSAAQRKAVEMRYYEDQTFEAIARELVTSPANVRQLVSRALRRLRRGP